MPIVTITDNTSGTFTGCEDAGIATESPTTPLGSATAMTISDVNDFAAVIKFSGLSNIPADATINSVTLRLYIDVTNGTGSIVFNRLLRNWVEAEATWNSWSTGNAWGISGAREDDVDRVGTPTATLSRGTSTGYVELSDAGLAADVQAWVSGSNPNYGWRIRDSDDYISIVTSEGTNGQRPELVVNYTAAGGSTTVNAGRGEIIAQGRIPTVNSFTNVRIREVLISEAGSPLANMSDMKLVVWYGGAPSGSPDLSYSAVTTDANGTMSYSLATGSLIFNQAIFYVLTDGSASLSAWTCGRIVPTYS